MDEETTNVVEQYIFYFLPKSFSFASEINNEERMAGAGKVVVVTGASRGIGYGIGKELSTRMPGATIYLTTRQPHLEQMDNNLRWDIGVSTDNARIRRWTILSSLMSKVSRQDPGAKLDDQIAQYPLKRFQEDKFFGMICQ